VKLYFNSINKDVNYFDTSIEINEGYRSDIFADIKYSSF